MGGRDHEINFYRSRAVEMIQKAQSAPTETTRQAYLSLAEKWTQEADSLLAEGQKTGSEDLRAPGERDLADKISPLPEN